MEPRGLTSEVQDRIKYLPPANEVWGEVMFLHLCVSLFTGGWLPSMHHRSHDQVPGGGGLSPWGGSASRGRPPRKAGGMHPIGILSCLNL